MNIYHAACVASKVLSEILGYEVQVQGDLFTLDVEYEAEPGQMTLAIKMPVRKAGYDVK